jgi:SAM-dependent methyltransferase
MPRLASQAKMGYYPMPVHSLSLIAQRLKAVETHCPHDRIQMLDPCCGTGEALETLAVRLWPMGVTYGIELDTERAAEATHQLQHVLQGSIFGAQIEPPGSFGLLWLNPPYEHDPCGERAELTFLKHATPWLAPGGVLVWILPESVAREERTAWWLWLHYEQMTACRVAKADYPTHRQVVIFARRRHEPPSDLTQSTISDWRERDWPYLDAHQPELTYTIPVTTPPKRFAMSRTVSEERIAADRPALARALATLFGWDRESATAVRPLLSLRTGHVVALLTAGYLNGRISNRLVIKGYAKRHRTERVDEEQETVTVTDTYAVGIRVLDLARGRWYDLT